MLEPLCFNLCRISTEFLKDKKANETNQTSML